MHALTLSRPPAHAEVGDLRFERFDGRSFGLGLEIQQVRGLAALGERRQGGGELHGAQRGLAIGIGEQVRGGAQIFQLLVEALHAQVEQRLRLLAARERGLASVGVRGLPAARESVEQVPCSLADLGAKRAGQLGHARATSASRRLASQTPLIFLSAPRH